MSQKGKKNNEIKLFGYLLLDILDLEDLVCLVVFPSSEIVISDQRFRDLRPTAPQTSCFWCDRESLRNQGSCYCIAEKKLYILSFFLHHEKQSKESWAMFTIHWRVKKINMLCSHEDPAQTGCLLGVYLDWSQQQKVECKRAGTDQERE